MSATSSSSVFNRSDSSSSTSHIMDESYLSSSNSRSNILTNTYVLSHWEAKAELEERIKILNSYFVQKDSNDSVDYNFKTPDKKSSSHQLNQIFGNSACGPLMSEYFDLFQMTYLKRNQHLSRLVLQEIDQFTALIILFQKSRK